MSTDLIVKLEQEANRLVRELDAHPDARKLFEGTADAGQYAGYLVQSYHYVRWTAPLLGLALTLVDVRKYASTGREDVYRYRDAFAGYYAD